MRRRLLRKNIRPLPNAQQAHYSDEFCDIQSRHRAFVTTIDDIC